MIEIGKSQTIQIGTKKFILDKMRVEHIEAVGRQVAEQIGDPFATAERFKMQLPAAELMKLIKEGEQLRDEIRGFSPDGRLWREFISTPSGFRFLIATLLKTKHSPEEIDDLMDYIGEQALAEKLLRDAAGKLPNGESARTPNGPYLPENAVSTGGASTSDCGVGTPMSLPNE